MRLIPSSAATRQTQRVGRSLAVLASLTAPPQPSATRRSLTEPWANVTVLGGTSSIGAPLSACLKLDPLVRRVSMWAHSNPNLGAIAEDIRHLPSAATVTDTFDLDAALEGADVVAICAGVAHLSAEMTRADLMEYNAPIIARLAERVAAVCPDALLLVVSNPPNILVPIAAEVLRAHGAYDARKLFGVSQLDSYRARSFAAAAARVDPATLDVPVLGGHDGVTMVPHFSAATPAGSLDQLSSSQLDELSRRVRTVGIDIVQLRGGVGSAAQGPARVCAEFAHRLLRARAGATDDVRDCVYCASDLGHAPFFASPVTLGREGVEQFLPIGALDEAEAALWASAVPELNAQIEIGLRWAQRHLESQTRATADGEAWPRDPCILSEDTLAVVGDPCS